jgi:hypothetical protein
VLFVFFAVFFSPCIADAQQTVAANSSGALAEVGTASVTVDGYARGGLSDLAGSLWGTSGRMSGAFSASASRFSTGSVTGFGEVLGSVALSSDIRNLSAVRIGAGGGVYQGRASSRYQETSIVLGRTTDDGTMGAWLDAGVGFAGENVVRTGTHARAAAELHAGSATVHGELAMSAIAGAQFTDATLHAAWAPSSHGPIDEARFLAEIDLGARGGDDIPGRDRWLAGTATVRLIGPMSLVARGGSQPSDPLRGTPGVAFTSVALRLETARSPTVASMIVSESSSKPTMVSRELGDGQRLITVLLPDARSVELMGDFTSWKPVTMSRSSAGLWQVRVSLGEGSHRLDVRADSGAWEPPPGIPSTADEFGGSVGILTVP